MQSENDGNEYGDIGGAGDGSDGDSDGNANPEDNEQVFFLTILILTLVSDCKGNLLPAGNKSVSIVRVTFCQQEVKVYSDHFYLN